MHVDAVAPLSLASIPNHTLSAAPPTNISRSKSEGANRLPEIRLAPTATSQSVPELHNNTTLSAGKSQSWEEFYQFSADHVDTLDRHMAALQREIHFFITSEENYVNCAKTFIQVFDTLGDTLPKAHDQAEFKRCAIDSVQQVADLNDRLLLKPLKEEQSRSGPFLDFPVAAVKTWIAAVKEPLLIHANGYQHANAIYRQHRSTNPRFQAYLASGSHESVRRVRADFSHLFETTRTRFPQYLLQLERIKKFTARVGTNYHAVNAIGECISELTGLMQEYNETHGRVHREVTMAGLDQAIRYKNAEDKVNLDLCGPFNHELVYQGKVSLKRHDMDTLEDNIDLLILDHFILLAKQDSAGLVVLYKPIHMDLLAIENVSDEAMYRRTAMHLASKMTRTRSDGTRPVSPLLAPTVSPNTRSDSVTSAAASVTATMSQTSRNSSIATTETHSHRRSLSAALDPTAIADLVFPIKIRNLATDQKFYVCVGKQIEREVLAKTLLAAKERYSDRVRQLGFEPFGFRVVDNGDMFRYAVPVKATVAARANPVDRALQDFVADSGAALQVPTAVLPGTIQCALKIKYSDKLELVLVGLDTAGLFAAQLHPDLPARPLNWTPIAAHTSVTELQAALPMNRLFVLADRILHAYKLNEVLLTVLSTASSSLTLTHLNMTPAVQLAYAVDCFKAGELDSKPYLFYSVFAAKSTITVLTPADASPVKKPSRFSRLTTSSKTQKTVAGGEFQQFDMLFTPTPNTAIQLFNKTFCVLTTETFEVLSLGRLVPQAIPTPHSVERLAGLDGVRRLGKPLYIAKFAAPGTPTTTAASTLTVLVYTKSAIICTAHGDLLTPTPLCFQAVGGITAAFVWSPYLVTVSARLIEVYRLTPFARDGRVGELVQVITGRNMTLLGHATTTMGEEWAVVGMAHPECTSRQVVLEFKGNEDVKEDQRMNPLTSLV